jgi:FkbM family methyltransferase
MSAQTGSARSAARTRSVFAGPLYGLAYALFMPVYTGLKARVVSRLPDGPAGALTKLARLPHPLWRLRGYAKLTLGGHRFRFYEIADPAVVWFGWRVWAGVWEPLAIEFFRQQVRRGDVVFDVGACFGAYSLLASRLVGPLGHVYAFEPDPVARSVLARNLAANRASNVTIVPHAVMARPGSAYVRSPRLGSASTTVSEEDGILDVEAVSLVSFCKEHSLSPAVIKVDVEGGEARVLTEEATPLVQAARAVLVEVHPRALRRDGVDPSAFRRQLDNYGKTVIGLDKRSKKGNHTVALSDDRTRVA